MARSHVCSTLSHILSQTASSDESVTCRTLPDAVLSDISERSDRFMTGYLHGHDEYDNKAIFFMGIDTDSDVRG